jgi:uncharacterized protein
MLGRFVILFLLIATCSNSSEPQNKIQFAAEPFSLHQVRLLDGPFHDAMLRTQKYLLELDADRLLHNFRVNAGIPSTAKPLGGWEAPDVELRGHSIGHFLSACALMYASTGDERFKSKAGAIVQELAKIQQALPSRGFNPGYLSAFPEEFFDRVDAGKKVWAPYYTLHKIMAGLLDMYTLCDNKTALDVLIGMADWVKFRVDRLSEEQQQLALQTEFGGMNELLANLYAVTENPEHLRIARKFDHHAVFDPLAKGEDQMNGLHANTQIPKAIGAAREYELTGEKEYYDIAEFFWKRVAHYRSYVIGGNSDGEGFFPIEYFSKHLGEETTETCNTYNMLKLTRHLFGWEPSAEMMDFYERGLFNHILASQDPASGMMTYYVPLKPGAFKTFSDPENSFWCCVGTGIENHSKYGDSIYFHNENSLFVNLYIASELNWESKGLILRQETKFPDEETTKLIFTSQKPVHLILKIRYPSWSDNKATIFVNGNKIKFDSKPGSYIPIDHEWKTGDILVARFPMSLRTESMPDDPNTIAFLYGPIVLAGDLGTIEQAERYGVYSPTIDPHRPKEVPVFISDVKRITSRVKIDSSKPLTFRTLGIGKPNDVVLSPFYKFNDHRYTVYWKIYSAPGWEKRKAEMKAADLYQQQIRSETVDTVQIGDVDNEKAHAFESKDSDTGIFEGKRWRATRSGWFSYQLKVIPDKPMRLLCTYWGGETRKVAVEIVVEGERIATEQLYENKPGEFYDREYILPTKLTEGKERITVKLQVPENERGSYVFDLRTLR